MSSRLLLTGCSILKKEIEYLIKENNWEIDTHFVDSSLHVDFDRLFTTLNSSLEKNRDREQLVFYGSCHPLIDRMIEEKHAVRTKGQNCVEMLLGRDQFTRELSRGAFFLLEEWVLRWEFITRKAFGKNRDIIRQIFQSEHRYFNCVRTVCSGDFTALAEEIGREIGLDLVWTYADLENLKKVISEAVGEIGDTGQ